MAQNTDLQSILATLAQFSQANQASQGTPQPASTQSYFDSAFQNVPAVQIDNSAAIAQNSTLSVEPSTDPRLRSRPQSRSVTPAQTPQPTNVIDPATITTWQQGLRCVTKIAAQNKMFESSIKRVSTNSTLSIYRGAH